MSFCQTGRPVACAQCAFDPCYARATVVRSKYHTHFQFSADRVWSLTTIMSFCQTGRPVACAQCAFDPCYARATVVRARFLAAAFSDGSYLAHVNDAYLRHVTFCIVRGPPLFIVSPISQRGPASVRGPLPTNSARLVQSPRRRRWRGWTNVQSNKTCVPYFSIM